MAKSPRKPDVHDAILDAASILYRRYGYRKTTMEDIAEEAGISRATIYLYFHGKDEIALAWGDRIAEQRRAALVTIARMALSPRERLIRMMIGRVVYSFEYGRDYSESIDEAFRALRPALLAHRDTYHENEAHVFADVIREGIASGDCAVEDADLAASILVLATNSLLPYSLSVRQLGHRQYVEKKAQALAGLLANGLQPCGLPPGVSAHNESLSKAADERNIFEP
jgi:AcrR family transcriptional regulator